MYQYSGTFNIRPKSGYYVYHMLWRCENRHTAHTHCTNMFYVILLLTAITDGVLVMEMQSVWCDKEIGFLNSISMSFTLQGAKTNLT